MSDQIYLPTISIPELQELITHSNKSALSSWTPPQVPAQVEKKFVSRKDLCDQFCMAYLTLGHLVKTGVLPTFRVGSRRILFKKEDVDNYLLNSREY